MSNNLPLISIIIPVYNVEKYLREALDSVVNQTYTNLEIIIVNDGSTDNSLNICNEYKDRDDRIRVISVPNGGLGAARNHGLNHATGEYISFLDSDDYCPNNAIELMYNALIDNGVDLTVGNCQIVIDDGQKLTPQKIPERKCEIISGIDLIKSLLIGASSACVRLYKKSLWDGLRFPEGVINEDEPILIEVYGRCNKVFMLDDVTYYYRKRSNSITTSDFSVKKLDMYYNAVNNEKLVAQIDEVLTEPAQYKVIKSLLYCLVNLYKKKRNDEEKQACKKLRADLRNYRKEGYLKNPLLPISYRILGYLFL